MPATGQLQVTFPGGEVKLYSLDPARRTTKIGRDKSNDLILDSPEIPLFLAVLDHQNRPFRISIVDSKRQVTLAGRALRPRVQYELRDGDKLEVCGHSIALMVSTPISSGPVVDPGIQTPGVAEPPVAPVPPPPAAGLKTASGRASAEGIRRAAPPSDRPDDLIVVVLPVREWTVDVEQAATCQLSVANGGGIVAQFEISVKDLDPTWVTITPSKVNLNEGEAAEITLQFRAPRLSTSRAGPHPFFVVVTSPNYPGRRSRQMATLTVNPYDEFTVGELTPRQQMLTWFKPTGRATWPISNKGNGEMPFRLNGADDAEGCQVEFEGPGQAGRVARQMELRLQPDQSADISVYTTPLARPLVAPSRSNYALTVTVSPLAGPQGPRSALGQVQYAPLISTNLLMMLLGVLLLVCIGGSLVLYSLLNPTPTPVPTVVPSPVIVPTATDPLAPIVELWSVSPTQVNEGQTVTIQWKVSGAESIELEWFGTVENSGQRTDKPRQTRTYTLVATNKGRTSKRVQEVVVIPATPTPGPTPTAPTPTPVPPTPIVLPPTSVPPTSMPPSEVTSVSASVSPTSGSSCPIKFSFSAVIALNGPGTVTYVWEKSDGASTPAQSLTFGSAGSQTVNDTWTVTKSGSGWARVRILAPNTLASSNATFTLNCPTPTFTSTPTPKEYKSGSLVVSVNGSADLDEGVLDSRDAADIWFEAVGSVGRIVPRNGAKIAKVGTSSVGYYGCKAAPLSGDSIDARGLSVGTYLCVFTNGKRYSEFSIDQLVVSVRPGIRISYTTWTEPVIKGPLIPILTPGILKPVLPITRTYSPTP